VWNDPINWVDPSGEFAQIAIGFVSGFVTDVLWQVVIDGHDLSCINYKRALIAGAADAAGIGLLKLFSKARRLYKFTKAAEEVAELAPKSAASLYDDVTRAGSRYVNRATDVTKSQFEKNLIDSGFTRAISKDGKAIILQKDGAKYILRDAAKSTGGATADFYKAGSKSIDLKIRLGE
jgi:hypothetical protein